MTLLLYGIAHADNAGLDAVRGQGPDLAVIEHEDIAMVARSQPDRSQPVGSQPDKAIPDRAIPVDRHVFDYLDTLVALARSGPVLPMAYGTHARDAEAVVSGVLAPSLEHYRRVLTIVEDLVEVRLDAVPDRDSGDGWNERSESVLSSLERYAESSRRLAAPTEDVQRSVWLVRRHRLPAFDSAVMERNDELPGAHLDYLGPLPIIHFLDVVADLGRIRMDGQRR